MNDEDLVYIFRSKKNTEVLGILYNRYAHLVYGVCMKYLKNPDDAKDASMQIFEKLFTDIPKYEIQTFKSWLYRVAQNHCFLLLRNNKHSTFSVGDFPDSAVEFEDNMHPILEKEDKLNIMEAAIEDINEDQRRCIKLFYLENKSYTDIMKETGFTFMQVKSFIQNGKRNIKSKMNEKLSNE